MYAQIVLETEDSLYYGDAHETTLSIAELTENLAQHIGKAIERNVVVTLCVNGRELIIPARRIIAAWLEEVES
jgi:hypothetical protein